MCDAVDTVAALLWARDDDALSTGSAAIGAGLPVLGIARGITSLIDNSSGARTQST